MLLVTLLSQKNNRSVAQFTRLIELSKELLEVIHILDEGKSRNKGKILKDLILASMNLSKIQLEGGLISEEESKEIAKECRDYAKEMIECYRFEKF